MNLQFFETGMTFLDQFYRRNLDVDDFPWRWDTALDHVVDLVLQDGSIVDALPQNFLVFVIQEIYYRLLVHQCLLRKLDT